MFSILFHNEKIILLLCIPDTLSLSSVESKFDNMLTRHVGRFIWHATGFVPSLTSTVHAQPGVL